MAVSLTSMLVVAGLGLAVAGFPMMTRRIPRNRWFGVRIRSTLANERVWYAVNERSGRDMFVLGVVVVLLTLGVPLVLGNWPQEFGVLFVAFVLVIGLAMITVRAVRHASRLDEGES